MISKNQENFVWGALLGGAIGAAAALLLTPYSGAEIRKQVRNRLNGKKVKSHSLPTTAPKKTRKKRSQTKTAKKHPEKS